VACGLIKPDQDSKGTILIVAAGSTIEEKRVTSLDSVLLLDRLPSAASWTPGAYPTKSFKYWFTNICNFPI
jgi:hypothetical protein